MAAERPIGRPGDEHKDQAVDPRTAGIARINSFVLGDIRRQATKSIGKDRPSAEQIIRAEAPLKAAYVDIARTLTGNPEIETVDQIGSALYDIAQTNPGELQTNLNENYLGRDRDPISNIRAGILTQQAFIRDEVPQQPQIETERNQVRTEQQETANEDSQQTDRQDTSSQDDAHGNDRSDTEQDTTGSDHQTGSSSRESTDDTDQQATIDTGLQTTIRTEDISTTEAPVTEKVGSEEQTTGTQKQTVSAEGAPVEDRKIPPSYPSGAEETTADEIALPEDEMQRDLKSLTETEKKVLGNVLIKYIDYQLIERLSDLPVEAIPEEIRTQVQRQNAAFTILAHIETDLTGLTERLKEKSGPLTQKEWETLEFGIRLTQNSTTKDLQGTVTKVNQDPSLPNIEELPDLDLFAADVQKELQKVGSRMEAPATQVVKDYNEKWREISENAIKRSTEEGTYFETKVNEHTTIRLWSGGEKAETVEVHWTERRSIPNARLVVHEGNLIIVPAGEDLSTLTPDKIRGTIPLDGTPNIPVEEQTEKLKFVNGVLVVPATGKEPAHPDNAKPVVTEASTNPTRREPQHLRTRVIPRPERMPDIDGPTRITEQTEFRSQSEIMRAMRDGVDFVVQQMIDDTRAMRRRSRRGDPEYGWPTRREMSRQDYFASRNIDKLGDRIIWGRSSGRLIAGGEGGHGLVVGPTGQGKSESIIVPNILARRGLVISTAVGSEIWKKTEGWARSHGDVYRWDPLDTSGEGTHRWNPLEHTRTWSESMKIANELISGISKGNDSDSNMDYWHSQARMLMTPLLYINGRYNMESPRHMGHVLEAAQRFTIKGQLSPLPKLAGFCVWQEGEARRIIAEGAAYGDQEKIREGLALRSDSVQAWNALLDLKEGLRTGAENARSAITMARQALEPWTDPKVQDATKVHEIDPNTMYSDDTFENRPSLYMMAHESDQERYRGLFLAHLMTHFRAHGENSERRGVEGLPMGPRMLGALDELPHIAPIRNYDQFLALSRKRWQQYLGAIQDGGQARRIWTQDGYVTVRSNSHGGRLLLPNLDDKATVDEFSAYFGQHTRTVTKESKATTPAHRTPRSTTTTRGKGGEISRTTNPSQRIPEITVTTKTDEDVREPIVRPEDITRLPDFTGIVALKNGRPIFVELVTAKQIEALRPRLGPKPRGELARRPDSFVIEGETVKPTQNITPTDKQVLGGQTTAIEPKPRPELDAPLTMEQEVELYNEMEKKNEKGKDDGPPKLGK